MSGPAGRQRLTETLAALAAIQRAAASGSLIARGDDAGVLVFDKGHLFKAMKESHPKPTSSGVPDKGDASLRSDAADILRAACLASGETAFVPASNDATRAVTPPVSLNAGDLILDLVRDSADAAWVRLELGNAGQIRHNTSTPPVMPRLALSASEGFLMSRADGTMSLDEIQKVSPLDDKETLIAIYALIAAGFLVAPGLDLLGELPRLADTGGTAAIAGAASQAAPASKRRISDLEAFLKRTSAMSSASPAERPAPSPAELAASAAEDRARIEKRIGDCQTEDLYAILGVDNRADENTIRRAYYRIAKHFHPDRHRREEIEDLFPAVEAMFAKTTDAYNTLTDDKERAEYDRHVKDLAGGARPTDADPASRARESYQRARKHLEAEELYDALRLLETACEMDPSKTDYWLYLGIVQTKNPKWRKKAEASLLKAADLNPGSGVPWLHLARLYKLGGLVKRSREMYEKLLEWEPGNDEALDALAPKPGWKKSLFKGSKS